MENYLNIVAQLETLDIFDDVTTIAFALMDKFPELKSEHIHTLLWLNTVLPIGKEVSPSIIVEATLIGDEKIKNGMEHLSKILRIEREKVYQQVAKTPELLLTPVDKANTTYDYLTSLGLSHEQIKDVFFEAVLLDEKALQERCEFVLQYWNVDDLVRLVKLKIFNDSPYYDSVEAINVAVDTLGAEKAMEFFISYPTFFIEYRAKEYRKLQYEIDFYNDALKALENFKNTI